MPKPIRIGTKQVVVYMIPVKKLRNDQDYEFVFVDHGNGKKVMAPF